MRHASEREDAVSKGSLSNGAARVDYYITVPSPSQCIAVGVVMWHGADERARRPRRMLVGKGDNEASAVADLCDRFTRICRPEPAEPDTSTPLAVRVQDPGHALQQPAVDGIVPEPGVASEAESTQA